MQFKNYHVRICFVKDGEMTDILSCLSMLPSSGITCNELMVKIPYLQHHQQTLLVLTEHW